MTAPPTIRVDNQAGLAVQVDAVGAAGARVRLGEAKSRTLRTFEEVPDIGAQWTLVAAYGGQQVYREDLAKTELADRNWTITIPPMRPMRSSRPDSSERHVRPTRVTSRRLCQHMLASPTGQVATR